MMKLIFLVEESSIAVALDILLPRILPDDVMHQIVWHQGKSDLEKSIPRKLRGWNEPNIRFVVMRDNDGSDCIALKEKLMKLCADNGRDDTLVRIVCQELEAWYIGDLNAVAAAYGKPSIARNQRKRKFRNPDSLGDPSKMIKELAPEYSKIEGSRAIAPYMDIDNNHSRSFQAFVDGTRRLANLTKKTGA